VPRSDDLVTRTSASDEAPIRTFLIADVRGYTLFTQERGDEAAAKLAAKFADIVRDVVESRGGTLLELRGDEALCVFGSAREAIRTAVDLQERFVEETIDSPELPLTVGIGLDAGEAVPVEGGYRGGALNLAARLCGQARAGEILASREVTHLARRIDGVRYEDRGSLTLKGLSDPVTVVRVVPEAGDPVERLQPFAPPAPEPPPSPRRWLVPVAIAAALALVVVALPLLRSDDASVSPGANSIASLNADDGSLELAASIGGRPGASAIGFGSLWVAHPDRGVVSRHDLRNGDVQDTIAVGAAPSGVAIGGGSVWVTNAADGTVDRINVDVNDVSDELSVGSVPSAIAFGDGALWVADTIGAALHRVEPTGETQTVDLSGAPAGIAFTPDGVWVSVTPNGIAQVDPTGTNVKLTQTIGNGPTAVHAAFGSIWVANRLDGTVSRLDPSTGRMQATIPVREGPNALVAASGSLWVANEFDDSVTQIDPETNRTTQTIPVGGAPASLTAEGSNAVWLAIGASSAEHRGGTLRVSSEGVPAVTLDPAILYDYAGWNILSTTNDGLLGYRKVGGPDGATLVPDLAAALPEVSSDGLTYRFPLRQGINYSTGEPVRPEDFRYAIERSVSLSDDATTFYGTIQGVRECKENPLSCDLSRSIVVDAGSVTFHLTKADPDLPFKLTLPFAFPVPVGTPIEDLGYEPVPATGPYMIKSATPGRVELVRNPEFTQWSGAAQPDGFVDAISWRFSEDRSAAFDKLDDDKLDWMADPPEPDDLAALLAEHPDQVVLSTLPWTHYVGMDLQKPPFDDTRVRQAINLAIDRTRVLELLGASTTWRPTCQILPPNFQGYEPFCPYTEDPESGVWTAPDLDRAHTLIDEAGVVGTRVTVSISDDPAVDDEIPATRVDVMEYVVEVMNDLGLRAKLEVIHEVEEYAGGIFAGERHAYLFGWAPDYPRASNFIELLFRCGSPVNVSKLCSDRIDAQIDEALRLEAIDPGAANRAWAAIDRTLVEDAVWIPLLNPVVAYAFSERAENVQTHPQWGVLLSRIWVQ
jgi:peptide/nickel transport system substrate-binding protein